MKVPIACTAEVWADYACVSYANSHVDFFFYYNVLYVYLCTELADSSYKYAVYL